MTRKCYRKIIPTKSRDSKAQNNCPLLHTSLCGSYCTTGRLLCQEVSNPALLIEGILSEKITNDELSYLARHDPLTGLYNKYEWERLASTRIVWTEADGNSLGLLFVDLTNFKKVNDTLGHSAGDKLLQKLALLMVETLRESDIGRSGGDEFVILVDLRARRNESLVPVKRLNEVVQRLSGEFEIFFESLSGLGADAAIGSCLWQPGMTLEELINLADDDMRRVKSWQHAKHGKHRD